MIAYRLNYNIGDYVDGKYHIVKQIGSGSYGDVFLVEDSLRQPYALKQLRLWEVTNDMHEGLVEKFELEYRTARLSSEYLVHSLDFGIVQGNPYILMEYCPDGDLSKIVGKDMSRLARYAHDILEGLHALHREGKIHRDLKPENVLFKRNGNLALTDFGVVGEMDKSKRLSEVGWWKKRPKQAMGTPLYMSPEIMERVGGGVTYLPTVDLWSFGVMMYELLTAGSFPFGNITKFEDLPVYQKRAKRGEWDRNRLLATQYGDEWMPILDGCLKPNYRDRYQDTTEIQHDLQHISGNIPQRPVHHEERLSRSMNIHRFIITQGDNLGATFVLANCLRGNIRMLRVGREISNDIVLPENHNIYVSRYHFTVERSADGSYWTLRDGQWNINERRWILSTNGTYLNATPVDQHGQKIFTGDIITAGEYKIKVE